ncbi:MAG: hypothetical protein K0S47_3041 [Herbinix sp.]|jgi:hypothetical protein|nr:hypothetical protein [Herbinix sp.]
MIFNYSIKRNRYSNFTGNHPVAVIVNFAVDGRFQPVYIRYVSDDSSENTFKVVGIEYTKDKFDCKTFCCLINVENTQYQVMLTFYFCKCLWVLEG